MCGIVGVIGRGEAAPLLLEALRRLEYRGYDSAGIATLVNGHIERRRAEGKLGNLAARAGAGAAGRHHRHRPHPLGDARRAHRAQRPPAQHRARQPWCTTASSRTTPSSAPSWRPRAPSSRRRPTPRPSSAWWTGTWRGAWRRPRPSRRRSGGCMAPSRWPRSSPAIRACCWRRGRARRWRWASAKARCSWARTRWRWRR